MRSSTSLVKSTMPASLLLLLAYATATASAWTVLDTNQALRRKDGSNWNPKSFVDDQKAVIGAAFVAGLSAFPPHATAASDAVVMSADVGISTIVTAAATAVIYARADKIKNEDPTTAEMEIVMADVPTVFKPEATVFEPLPTTVTMSTTNEETAVATMPESLALTAVSDTEAKPVETVEAIQTVDNVTTTVAVGNTDTEKPEPLPTRDEASKSRRRWNLFARIVAPVRKRVAARRKAAAQP